MNCNNQELHSNIRESLRFSALLSLSSRVSGVICAPCLHCSTAQNYCVARSEANKCVMWSGNCGSGSIAKNIYLDNNNKRYLSGEKMICWVVSHTFNIEQFSIKWNITLTCQLTCRHDKPFSRFLLSCNKLNMHGPTDIFYI